MDIKTALDWTKVEFELLGRIQQCKPLYQTEAKKLVRNIGLMVSQLSKLELESRRSAFKSQTKVKEQLVKINNQIYELEQWITLLMLY